MCWMFFLIFPSQIIKTEERVDQAGPADRLKQAPHTHTAEAESPCFRLHWRAGFSYFPLHELCLQGSTYRTDRADMKKDHCDNECCKNKMSPEELLCFETREKKMTIPSTFHVTVFHSKWSILYLFFYTCSEFLSPVLIKVIYFWDFLRMLNGSGVCTFWVLYIFSIILN